MESCQYSAKQIFFMSLPIFVELLLQLLVGNVDQFMMSRVSQDAVAAIGNGNQIMNLVIIFLNVMSVATTILLSQYLGAKEESKITQVCNVSMVVMTVVSILSSLVLVLFATPIFTWLQVPQTVLGYANSYLTIVGSFVLVQGLYLAFSSILRSFACLKEVLVASAAMNLLNIVGNAILIEGMFGLPRLGIVGAAISTNISKCVGLALAIWYYRRKVGNPLSLGYLRPFPTDILKRLLFIGLPSGGEALSYNLSQTCILKFVNIFGTAVIATRVYCNMLANVAYLYSQAVSQATQIVIGYLVGGGRTQEIGRKVWSTIGISMAVSMSLTFVMYLASDRIFGLFTSDPFIWQLGRQILFLEIFLELGRSVNITMVRCLVAVGDVNFPVFTGVFSMWLVATLGSWFFGVFLGWGLPGIWLAMVLDECLRGGIFTVRFLSGAWKRKLPQDVAHSPTQVPSAC